MQTSKREKEVKNTLILHCEIKKQYQDEKLSPYSDVAGSYIADRMR